MSCIDTDEFDVRLLHRIMYFEAFIVFHFECVVRNCGDCGILEIEHSARHQQGQMTSHDRATPRSILHVRTALLRTVYPTHRQHAVTPRV